MTGYRHEIEVRAGEVRRRCAKCGLWGRRSPNPRRSDFHWNTDKFHPHCRDCHNRRLRAAYLAKHGGYVRPRIERVLIDDYGVEIRVRRCRLCYSWLAASKDLFALRRGGLSSECRTCSRERLAEYRRRNRQHVRAKNRQSYANRAIDRFLKAEQEGRVFKPRLQFEAPELWLPTTPELQAWLRRAISALDEESRSGQVEGGVKRLAELAGCSERTIRRLRDGGFATVRVSLMSALIEAAPGGGGFEDIWPDYEEALRLGDALRFDTNRRLSRERSAA